MDTLSPPTRRAPLDAGSGRVIEAGQVACPIHGIVDLERCFGCPGFEGIREGTTERLVCRPDRDVAAWATADETWEID